ncbi:endo alpha-1,4 polygalactosaminidase [bacterium]|nr:endo alpha-1,4 polygalactosaminidase [bacterium]
MKTIRKALLISIFSLFIACGGSSGGSGGGINFPSTGRVVGVSSWGYQLQDIDLDEVGASDFDLVVVDYSADGSDEEAFSEDDVNTMRGNNNKLVISYFSIGEAEDYRYYFDAGASYVDAENPDFPGNFKVFYWEDEWQELMEGYLDKIIAAGFDGAYLDIIDAYEYYGPGGDSGLDRDSAADDMTNFVIRLANYARAQNEDFIIIPQNGSGIINDASNADDYLSMIDAIGVEDTFYFGDAENDNDLDQQDEVIDNLLTYQDNDIVVLSVDYVTDADKVDNFYNLASDAGYIPYATIRALDALTMN